MCACVCVCLCVCADCFSSKGEDRLFRRLFRRYNQFIRPVENVSDPVTVEFEVSISQLVKVVRKPVSTASKYVTCFLSKHWVWDEILAFKIVSWPELLLVFKGLHNIVLTNILLINISVFFLILAIIIIFILIIQILDIVQILFPIFIFRFHI